MAETVQIGLVGDYDDAVGAHRAIPRAFELVEAVEPGVTFALRWIPTPEVDAHAAARLLAGLDGLWCVPGSPYANMDGALAAIRHAREERLPFLGTCGGFQHALIEVARNVLGLAGAEHAESSPDAESLLISQLSCSLAGVRGRIHFPPGARLATIYGAEQATESYQCNYGLNPRYRALIASSPLRIAALDDAGDVRGVELPAHPFFVATLFQPELTALAGAVHPLVRAFAHAAAAAN
jgi:CTP synthase (UTP-ammonia lyase)